MNKELLALYRGVDACLFCRRSKNYLQHIHGFGALQPRFMLVLVNPTHRNLSSHPAYHGPRFPFIGVRQFWKVLARGGLIDKDIAERLPLKKDWNEKHTEQIKRELIRNKLYLTNVVKCCYDHSAYPVAEVLSAGTDILAREIALVRPQKIIAFGGLVYKTLTGKNIKLADYWNGEKKKEVELISGLNTPIEPCYFPIGRGNPGKAVEILRKFA